MTVLVIANKMIQNLPCSSCNRLLLLRAEVSTDAVVRCPHCGYRFVVADLIQSDLGKWEVMSDLQEAIVQYENEPSDEKPAVETPNPKLDQVSPPGSQTTCSNDTPSLSVASTADPLCDDQSSQLEGGLTDPEKALLDAEPQGDLEPVLASEERPVTKRTRTTDWSKFEPVMPGNRRRRRRPASVFSVVPTILGGLAAIPVALLLIWFVLGADPMKMAPAVARYAPWLVPNRLQRPQDLSQDEVRLPKSSIPDSDEFGFHSFEDLLAAARKEADLQGELSSASPASAEPKTENESPLLTAITEHEDEPEGTPVIVLLNRVQSGLTAWRGRTGEKAEQRRIAKELYSDLSELSIATSKRTVPALQTIGATVLQNEDVYDLINQGARHWYSKRNTEAVGLAICCEIQDIEKVEGQWVVSAVTTGKTPTPVRLHLIDANIASPKLGTIAFVLGVVPAALKDSDKIAVESTPNSLTINAHYMQSHPAKSTRLTQVGNSNDRRQ
jgi:hypothetical protein